MLERRLAVILMADMVDYSRLMEADQDRTIGLIQALRNQWLEPKASACGGEVLKRLGDGWVIAFSSVSNAVKAAIAIQDDLYEHSEIQLRLAAHLGEIVDDGSDLYGSGLNIAARLQTEAPPGGLMISEDLYRQLDARLADGFSDAGTFALKNIAVPITGYQWRPARRGVPRTDDVPAIAVEPMAATPDNQELREAAADLQEQLVYRLSRRTGIRVLALDGAGEASPTYILRGRLRHRGGVAKLTLTLVVHADGRTMWSEVYEEPTQDLFEFCDQSAAKTDNDLRLEINAFDGERLADLPDAVLSASELRTRAAYLFYRTGLEDYERAAALMTRAVQLDPNNAMNLAMWVDGRQCITYAKFEVPSAADIAAMVDAIDKAIEYAPRSDYVFAVRAHIRTRLLHDLEGARRDIVRGLKINPDYVIGLEIKGLTELAAGSFASASEILSRCIARGERDPWLPFRMFARAVALLLADRPDAASRVIEEAIELRRHCRAYHLLLAEAQAATGAERQAKKTWAYASELPNKPDMLASCLPLPVSRQALMSKLAPACSRQFQVD